MCGITGIISLDSYLGDKELTEVKEMQSLMLHRGPDQQAVHFHPRCILANNRLAIIDPTDKAALPMSDMSGNIWLCYQGEISNFQALKKKYRLTEKYPFKSQSDTEVIIYLYKEQGIQFLEELTGMFAFCLLDTKKNKAYLVRDFYGINPLFYLFHNQKIYFASEIKAFLSLPFFDHTLDTEAIYHYFSLAYIPGERTPYRQAKEMRGGQLLEVDLEQGKYQFKKYYQLQYEQRHEIGEKQAVREVRERLFDAVERNLVADVPLGILLSGGVDSSSIIGIAKMLGRTKNMHTFSLKIGQSSFDESGYQQMMVDYAQTRHHQVTITPEKVMEHLVQHIAYLDEPSGDGAVIPCYSIAREASKYVKVLLSGEGGDEVFMAYPTHGAYKVRKLYRRMMPALIRKLIHKGVHQLPVNHSKLSFDFKAKRFTEGAELDTPDAHLYWRHVFTESEKLQLMPGVTNCLPTATLFSDLFYSCDFDHLNRISLIDIEHFFIDDLMVKNDRMFMAHSVETRYPFMDRLLVDYVTKLPVQYKIKRFKRRYIQKEAMRGIVPDAILKRQGFGLEMPHSLWFFNELAPVIHQYLNRENVERTGLLSWEAVNNIWQMHLAGKKDYGRAIWSILTFLIWFDIFIYRKNYRQYLTNHHNKMPGVVK